MTPDIAPDMTAVHNTLLFVAILSQQDKICQLAALQYKADNEMESPPTLLVCCGIGIVHHLHKYVYCPHAQPPPWDQWAGNEISPLYSIVSCPATNLSVGGLEQD